MAELVHTLRLSQMNQESESQRRVHLRRPESEKLKRSGVCLKHRLKVPMPVLALRQVLWESKQWQLHGPGTAGVDGVEAKIAGIGFSVGPKTSVSLLGNEVSCCIF